MAEGFDLDLFWSLTPREVQIYFLAAAERRRLAHNDRAWQAYNTAFLPAQKKPPKLKELQIPPPGKKSVRRRQSPEEQEAIAREWMARRKR